MVRLRLLPLILLVNGGVALLTSGVALLVLLIAPLGLTAVITCTALVAVLSFVSGVVADLALLRWLLPATSGTGAGRSEGEQPPMLEPRTARLPGWRRH
jgi:hypothetical protein